MTELIALFKMKKVGDNDLNEFSGEDINDMFREIAEKNDMEFICWGTI